MCGNYLRCQICCSMLSVYHIIIRGMCEYEDDTFPEETLSCFCAVMSPPCVQIRWQFLLNSLQPQISAPSITAAVTRRPTVTRRNWSSTAPVRVITKETDTPASPSTGGCGLHVYLSVIPWIKFDFVFFFLYQRSFDIMLFFCPGVSRKRRIMAAAVTLPNASSLVRWVKTPPGTFIIFLLVLFGDFQSFSKSQTSMLNVKKQVKQVEIQGFRLLRTIDLKKINSLDYGPPFWSLKFNDLSVTIFFYFWSQKWLWSMFLQPYVPPV